MGRFKAWHENAARQLVRPEKTNQHYGQKTKDIHHGLRMKGRRWGGLRLCSDKNGKAANLLNNIKQSDIYIERPPSFNFFTTFAIDSLS